MYETYYDKLQPYFCREDLQLHGFDTDGFLLSVKIKDNIKDLEHPEDVFDFSNLSENHEPLSDKIKKNGNFKIETFKNLWIDEFLCLRTKIHAYKCGDDSKIKLKVCCISQSKNGKFDEYKNV